MAYLQAEIDQLAREVKALKESKCPFYREHLEVDEDNEKEKVIPCQNCKGVWVSKRLRECSGKGDEGNELE